MTTKESFNVYASSKPARILIDICLGDLFFMFYIITLLDAFAPFGMVQERSIHEP
jgi:hypothetical protein